MSHVMTLYLTNKQGYISFQCFINHFTVSCNSILFGSKMIHQMSIWVLLLSFLAFFISSTLFILSLSIPSLCLFYPMSFPMIINYEMEEEVIWHPR